MRWKRMRRITEADGSQSKDDFKDKKTKDGSEDTVIKCE